MFHTSMCVYLSMCLSYPSSLWGDQLIRFSFETNMSRPQESGYMEARYKGYSIIISETERHCISLIVMECIWLT